MLPDSWRKPIICFKLNSTGQFIYVILHPLLGSPFIYTCSSQTFGAAEPFKGIQISTEPTGSAPFCLRQSSQALRAILIIIIIFCYYILTFSGFKFIINGALWGSSRSTLWEPLIYTIDPQNAILVSNDKLILNDKYLRKLS